MIPSLVTDPPIWVRHDATAIDLAGVDIAVVPPNWAVPAINDLAMHATGRVDTTVAAGGSAERIARAIAPLGLTAPGLSEWMAAAVNRFAAITETDTVKFRVEITEEITCPKFHVDSVHVRLVSTLIGAGTEYVHRDDPLQVHQAKSGDLVLLKGRRHPTHSGTVLHRSPVLSAGARRLVMVLDC